MILNVDLIKNSSIYCSESALATAANWLKRDYRMMFSGMLGFDFVEKGDLIQKRIGERVNSGILIQDIVYALKYYHGIVAERKQIDGNIKEVIIEQINQEAPILTYISPVFCDWTDSKYYKVYFLIIGYDDCFVYGYDLHNNSNNIEKLSLKTLEENYIEQKEVQVYKIGGNEKKIDFEEIKKIVKNKYDVTQTPIKMKKFADELEDNYAKEFECEYYIDFRSIPLLEKLADIVRGRKLFSEACYYVAEKTGDQFAQHVGICYADIGEQWNVVWSMLAKVYALNKEGNVEDKVRLIIKEAADRIRKVADVEKDLMSNMFGECKIYEKLIKASNNIEADSGYEYKDIDIDISHFFDNKAFEETAADINADLTGHGECFQCGELPDDRMIHVGKTEFYINTGYDNLICNNQIINVQPNVYKKIYILGCAEWGNGSGKVQIGNDVYEETLLLEFPDWYYCKMNKNTVWRGKAVDFERNNVERGLFCLDFKLNESEIISKIKLPVATNVHIFGIKLLT